MLGGGAIGWSSKLQTVVALSSTEAEYMAAVEAGKEIMWMHNILGEFGYPVMEVSTLGIDNLSAISVSKNLEHFGCMKHLDLCFFWLRDIVETGVVAPYHVPGVEQPADMQTQAEIYRKSKRDIKKQRQVIEANKRGPYAYVWSHNMSESIPWEMK